MKRLPGRVRVDPLVDPGVERLEQIAIGLRRDQRALLGTEIGTCHEHGGDLIADPVMNAPEVGQGNLALAVEDVDDVLRSRDQAHVPLLKVPDALGVPERVAGHQRDVAEAHSPGVDHERAPSRAQSLDLRRHVVEVDVAQRYELLGVVRRV